jgi:hypothetical protein
MMFTLEVGTKLKIVLWLNAVQVSTGGLVMTRDLQVGNGIKFIDLATEERLRLKRFLAVAGNPQSPESTNQTGRGRSATSWNRPNQGLPGRVMAASVALLC